MSQKSTKWKQLIKQCGNSSRAADVLIPSKHVKSRVQDGEQKYLSAPMNSDKAERFTALIAKVYR